MGELTRIDGMKIKMYPFDTQRHKEPHFHVILANGKSVSVSIADGSVLEGKLERRDKELVMGWMFIHREEIWDRWNKAVSGNFIEKIPTREI